MGETGLAAQDFVAKGDLVAFRVCEIDQGLVTLNGDEDQFDCVMHVLKRSTDQVKNTGRAAERCELPGCDPFFEPFRVGVTSVSFLTTESDQDNPLPDGVPGLGCTPGRDPDERELGRPERELELERGDRGRRAVAEAGDEPGTVGLLVLGLGARGVAAKTSDGPRWSAPGSERRPSRPSFR